MIAVLSSPVMAFAGVWFGLAVLAGAGFSVIVTLGKRREQAMMRRRVTAADTRGLGAQAAYEPTLRDGEDRGIERLGAGRRSDDRRNIGDRGAGKSGRGNAGKGNLGVGNRGAEPGGRETAARSPMQLEC